MSPWVLHFATTCWQDLGEFFFLLRYFFIYSEISGRSKGLNIQEVPNFRKKCPRCSHFPSFCALPTLSKTAVKVVTDPNTWVGNSEQLITSQEVLECV